MIEIGRRRRTQAPPAHVVFEALTQPRRPGGRPWLVLLDDEVAPSVIDSRSPVLVVWSSIWSKRPDALIRFEIEPAGSGCVVTWSLHIEAPEPPQALVGHLRKRVNELINAQLRFSFGG